MGYKRIIMKYTVVSSIVPLLIDGLAFEPAIRRHQRQPIAREENKSTRCPFAKIPKLFGPSLTDITESSIERMSVEYKRDNHMKYSNTPPATVGHSRSTSWKSKYVALSEKAYRDALAFKCPFFRRRATDVLEFVDNTVRMYAGRTIASFGPAISLRGPDNVGEKLVGLSAIELVEIIRKDWREETNKGYYVTGRLTTNIYRDDCLFDGPDPDMPVRGLRKYMNAASQLFDYKSSTSQLLSLKIHEDTVIAKWKFNGTMRLPWRPKLPEVCGSTTYFIDTSGLVYKHIETWDISAFRAFFQTFFPGISHRIWPTNIS